MGRGRTDIRSTEKPEKGFNGTMDNHSYPDMNPSDVHILAVDDSVIDRKLIERMLRTSSYRVTTVESVSRALDVLGVGEERTPVAVNAYQINFIITDYCMPGMTGYDLLRTVKEISSLKDIPVVIMSSENVPNRMKRCLAEGAEEFILKPVQLADVKRLLYQTRSNTLDQSVPPPGNKRKVVSESFGLTNSGRQPSLNGVAVP